MNEPLKILTGQLSSRFFIVVFLPSLTFCLLLVPVFFADGPRAAYTAWESQPLGWRLGVGLLFALGVFLLAAIIDALEGPLLRLYHGEWPTAWGRRHAAQARAWHAAQIERLHAHVQRGALDSDEYLQRIYATYPAEPGDAQATRLGNIDAAVHSYARLRYQINFGLFWPRLFQVLPERTVKMLTGSRASMVMMLVIVTLAAAYSLVAPAILIARGAPWQTRLIYTLGGLTVAALAYSAALAYAATFAEQQRSAVDLYRGELRKQLGLLESASLSSERERWRSAEQLIVQNYNGPALPAPAPRHFGQGRGRGGRVAPEDELWLILALLGVLLVILPPYPAQALVQVPTRSLGAYTLLQAGDLTAVSVPLHTLPDDPVLAGTPVVGRYTVGPVGQGIPLLHRALAPSANLTNTVAVDVALDGGGLGATLQPGERVDLIVVPDERGDPALSLADLTVLGVSPVAAVGGLNARTVVVLAIPAGSRDAVVGALVRGSPSITRRASP